MYQELPANFADPSYGHHVPAYEWPFYSRMLAAGAKGFLPVKIGSISGLLTGGPYRLKPADVLGIKMAQEIKDDCLISVPTVDFSIPDREIFVSALYLGITMLHQKRKLWVGCMGGIGRTGLYFAGMAKVMWHYQILTKKKPMYDPIVYVRENYYEHAVETNQQMSFINSLDLSEIAVWTQNLQKYKSKII